MLHASRSPNRTLAAAALCAQAMFLAGCTADGEKLVRFEEELATIVETNKDDCEKMAAALTKLGEAKGKEAQALKRKVVPKGGEAQATFTAARKEKYGPRLDAIEKKVRAGMQCLLTSESVARAMLVIEGDGEDQPGRAAPARPDTGAPVAFVVDKTNPRSLDVSVYNFGDKMVGSYGLMIRYTKADGSPVRSEFSGKDFMPYSISGKAYRVPPKAWRSFTLDRLETPAGAVKAEILADAVRATDGIKIDQEPLWRSSRFEWPVANK